MTLAASRAAAFVLTASPIARARTRTTSRRSPGSPDRAGDRSAVMPPGCSEAALQALLTVILEHCAAMEDCSSANAIVEIVKHFQALVETSRLESVASDIIGGDGVPGQFFRIARRTVVAEDGPAGPSTLRTGSFHGRHTRSTSGNEAPAAEATRANYRALRLGQS